MSRLAIAVLIAAILFIPPLVSRWKSHRTRREESKQARFIREECTPAAVPPAPDNVPGINLADHDECELILSLPEYGPTADAIDEGLARLFEHLGPPPAHDPAWDAGLERLWDAARDHTNTPEGDA